MKKLFWVKGPFKGKLFRAKWANLSPFDNGEKVSRGANYLISAPF